MDDLVTWLREQIDADERAVEGACVHIDDCNGSGYGDRFDDARVLAEVEAKRARIDLLAGELESAESDLTGDRADRIVADLMRRLLNLEAHPLASRPGFRDEWRLT